ncbi:hypothetical protein [Ruminiclostridium josui]|uniref:hypothetical protein n=1 Tax=Ruminiclostridium josui TaxID=1499 RepID=UPI0004B339EB|nr:hypothetical protein [Ruminiclostridium josui]
MKKNKLQLLFLYDLQDLYTGTVYKLQKTGYVNLTLNSLSDNNNWMFFVNKYNVENGF